MRTLFPAIIDLDPAGGYGVTFPDVPGCTSAGDTIEEAVAMAEEALAQHLEVMAEIGADMPAPTELADLARPEKALTIMLIPGAVPAPALRINITMDPHLIERIDAAAGNRSAFLAEAAREKLSRTGAIAGPKVKKGRRFKVGVSDAATGKDRPRVTIAGGGVTYRKHRTGKL